MEIAPIWITLMSGICWWYLFHKYMKISFSTAPDIFKPLLKRSIFKCISWLNGSFGERRGFLKEGVKTYRMNGTNVASQLAKFFCVCTSIVYGFSWTFFPFTVFCGFILVHHWVPSSSCSEYRCGEESSSQSLTPSRFSRWTVTVWGSWRHFSGSWSLSWLCPSVMRWSCV